MIFPLVGRLLRIHDGTVNADTAVRARNAISNCIGSGSYSRCGANVRSGAVAGCTIFARGTFCPQSVCLADKLCFCPRERPVILSEARITTNHTAQCTIGPEDDRPTGQLTNGSIVRLCGER